ncbi:MAG: hypothetical protein ACRDGK_00505, partial [Actinomycetota bacterium]
QDADGRRELIIVDPTSGAVITPTQETGDVNSLAWSPDSRSLAFVAGNGLFVISVEDMNPTLVAEGGYPTWSPDGTQIAYQNGESIHVTDVDGAGDVRLAEGFLPAWSPTDARIAFVDNADLQIIAMNADGTERTRLTDIPSDDTGRPTWAPDGSRIAFEVLHDGDYDIYAIDEDGTGLDDLTQGRGDENVPTWSPDGTKIAFIAGKAVSDNPRNTGTFDIHVIDADGTQTARLTDGRAPAYALSWQRLESTLSD